MSLTSANLQAGLRNQARLERQRNKPVKQTKKSNSKEKLSAGMISQRKLSNVMEGLSKVPQFANGPPVRPPTPYCLKNIPRAITDDPLLDEAVKAIVELNRENLTQEQMVDLLASFYYVTNRYFRQLTFQAITKSPGKCADPESRHQSIACIPEATVSLEENNNSEVPPSQSVFSLREKKRIQWIKEQEEMSRLGKASQYPAPVNYNAPSQSTDRYWRGNDLARQGQLPLNGQPASSIARTVPTPYVPLNNIQEGMSRLGEASQAPVNYNAPSQGTDRYWRANESVRQGQLPLNGPPASSSIVRTVPNPQMPPNNNQGGFFIGEDPGIMAAQKERQRQEWLAELDRQVQEKKALKEQEKTLVLSEDIRTQAPCTPVYLRRIDPTGAGSVRYDDRVPRLHVADKPPPPPQPQPAVNGTHEPSPSVMTNRTPPEEMNPIQPRQQPPPRELLNQNTSAEQGFSRGRGLANLEERSNEAAIKRKQQQLELQAAYDKQIKEREARRKEERERLLREELAEAERIERERQQMEEEARAEEQRRRELLIATQEQNRQNAKLFEPPPSRVKAQSPDISVAATEKQMSAAVVDSPLPKLSRRTPTEVAVDERPILTMDRPLPTSHRQIPNGDEPIPTVNRRIVGVPQPERPPSRPLDAPPAFHTPMPSCAATNPTTNNRPTNGTPRRPVNTQVVSRANGNAYNAPHRKGTTTANYRRPPNRGVSGVLTPTDFNAAARAEYNRQESFSSRRTSDSSTPLAIIRTQSNLCPPAADFLSAITNPDYAYEGVCAGLEKCQVGQNATHTRAVLRPSEGLPQRSALEQVSKIKRNLLQRQEELRSMQMSASNNNRPH